MSPQKIGGVIILLFGPPLALLARDSQLFFVTVSLALMMLFFAKEPVNDERVDQLKMKALFWAMSVGVGGTAVARYYLHWMLSAVSSIPRSRPYQELTAYEFISSVFLIALGLFHYWRWQDARPRESGS